MTFTIRPWTPGESAKIRQMVERVQRRRDVNFNPEGPEGDDCTWAAGYYSGDEGQLFIAIDKENDELLACAAATLGTSVAMHASGASESEDSVAAMRRVCVDFEAVPAGDGRRETILRALFEEAQSFARQRGARRAIALGYEESGNGCQPSPELLSALGYIKGDPLPGCQGVYRHSSELAPDVISKRSNFAGRWKMDLRSSDSLRKVLGALGMNFFLIQVVGRLAVQQEITQGEDTLMVQVKTPLGTDAFELPFDGTITSVPGATGGQNRQTSSWIEAPISGQLRLRTVQAVEGTLDNPQSSSLFETVRSLGDQGSTLFEDVAVFVGGERVASARRVLRRQPE